MSGPAHPTSTSPRAGPGDREGRGAACTDQLRTLLDVITGHVSRSGQRVLIQVESVLLGGNLIIRMGSATARNGFTGAVHSIQTQRQQRCHECAQHRCGPHQIQYRTRKHPLSAPLTTLP
ncbi:hypothetical protein ATO49_01670 [Mycolicibacterium fortuitum subsp. fortuitum DSM 46621 = ATCC 6841 = JCM 6387]|nr:hypothetical protein ATO49_01670 [Mycolicibacterium fortuitum subsp. fortuitum DSM 46621 = ATCC 6841 = JCM 6387]